MSPRHRTPLLGVRSGTRWQVTFCNCVIESPYYADIKFDTNLGLFSNNTVFALRVLMVSAISILIISFVPLRVPMLNSCSLTSNCPFLLGWRQRLPLMFGQFLCRLGVVVQNSAVKKEKCYSVRCYRYARHNDVSVNDGPHIRRWPH
jgi:hypothetical protein